MPGAPKFSLSARGRSFGYAITGLRLLVRNEHNARIHLVATVAVVIVGFMLEIDRNEWRWLIIAAALVWMAEAFNTSIERLADVVTLERDPRIALVKDVAAGGVLVCSIAAALIGVLTLVPYLRAFVD